MLAEQTDYVIGVDTHRDRHSAAILASSGGLVDETSASTDRVGYAALLGWAHRHAAGRRVWAIEGSGSYGAGLVRFLAERGEDVGRRLELDRPGGAVLGPLRGERLRRPVVGHGRGHDHDVRAGAARERLALEVAGGRRLDEVDPGRRRYGEVRSEQRHVRAAAPRLGELALALTGETATVVERDASPQAEREVVVWNPPLLDPERPAMVAGVRPEQYLDLAALRDAATPILIGWARAVQMPDENGTLVTVDPSARDDMAILVTPGPGGQPEVTDYAYKVQDEGGVYWQLASGDDVLDGQGVPIARPTLADVLAQQPSEGEWTSPPSWSCSTPPDARDSDRYGVRSPGFAANRWKEFPTLISS